MSTVLYDAFASLQTEKLRAVVSDSSFQNRDRMDYGSILEPVNPKVTETINAVAAVTSSQLVTITIHLYQFWRAKTDGRPKSITGICSGERHDQ